MYNIETTEAPLLFENHHRVGQQEYLIQMCFSYAFERHYPAKNEEFQSKIKFKTKNIRVSCNNVTKSVHKT